jgi:hypothetical protein
MMQAYFHQQDEVEDDLSLSSSMSSISSSPSNHSPVSSARCSKTIAAAVTGVSSATVPAAAAAEDDDTVTAHGSGITSPHSEVRNITAPIGVGPEWFGDSNVDRVLSGWVHLRCDQPTPNTGNVHAMSCHERELFFEMFSNHTLVYHEQHKRTGRQVQLIDLEHVYHVHRYTERRRLHYVQLIFETSSSHVVSLRFDNEHTRDAWYQSLQLYVCDHFDVEPVAAGQLFCEFHSNDDQTECNCAETPYYAVATCCALMFFQSEAEYLRFSRVVDTFDGVRKLDIIHRLVWKFISLRTVAIHDIRISDSKQHGTTIVLSPDTGTLHLRCTNINQVHAWLSAIHESVEMFHLVS